MFFFTKLAGALLKPLTLVMAGLVLGLLLAAFTRWRRAGLSLVALATLGLGLISTWPLAQSLVAPLEQTYPPLAVDEPLPDDVTAIVVLGGGGVDAPSLPLTAQLSESSLQRLVEGIRLWRMNPEAVLVTSGALSTGRPQAAIAADLAVALGVPRAQIHTLPDARNTEEEAAAYAELASRLEAEPGHGAFHRPVVVSAASHLPRALDHFRHAGLDPLPAPIAHRAVERPRNRPGDFAPGSHHLRTTEMAWHERLGQLWNRVRGR